LTQLVNVLRDRSEDQRVTHAELFFDLVFVFAVTQLSHRLITEGTIEAVLQSALLLAMVWLAWVYTTWVTNWLDPVRIPVRVLLLLTAMASLVMSSALPRAFADRAWVVAGAYTAMQIGRSAFVVVSLRRLAAGDDEVTSLRRNYQRILSWSVASGAFALAGAGIDGHARELLWFLAVAIDLLGGVVGFFTPGLGRSSTEEWTIEGGHFAERCQAFILIALGESVVVIGATFADVERVTPPIVFALGAAFVGAIGFWWMYFDRSADAAAGVIAESDNPGALGRSAYHFVHPVMIAGIIVTAAADDLVLAHPTTHPHLATVWMILGGTALFIGGHGLFTWVVWRVVPWSRVSVAALLVALVPVGTSLPALGVGGIALALTLVVLVLDYVSRERADQPAGEGAWTARD
jgi:low temperature requirement protein LtrA